MKPEEKADLERRIFDTVEKWAPDIPEEARRKMLKELMPEFERVTDKIASMYAEHLYYMDMNK